MTIFRSVINYKNTHSEVYIQPMCKGAHVWVQHRYLCVSPALRPRLWPLSESEKSICPSDVLGFVWTWFSSTNNIDWRLKNEGGVSLAKIVVLNGLNQILCYCGHVQDILDASFLAFFPEWDIAEAGSIRRS